MARLGFVLALCLAGTAARADGTIDLSTLTCQEMKASYSDSAELLIAWAGGYAGAKTGSMTLDLQGLGADIERIETYCDRNPTATLMQAVEAK